MPARNDYLEIFERGGADGLNRTLRERWGPSGQLETELMRMEKSGYWRIAWDDETGEGLVVARLTVQPAVGRAR